MSERERNYRQAFLVVAAACIGLAGALGYVLWTHGQAANAAESNSPVVAKGPDVAGETPITTTSGVTSPLAPVQLSPQRMQAIGVKIATVELRTVNDELRVPGNVDMNEGRLTYVQTRFPGWIQKIYANATYQYVRKGQPLFTIYSPELVSTEQEYVLAKQNEKSFASDGHDTASRESGWLLQAATDRLRQFGVPPNEIARLEQTGVVQHDVTIESPTSGYITEFNALPNQSVQADTKLYTIADLSTVWVHANVFQSDVGALRPGTPAAVTTDAYPGRTFKGRVEQVLPQVDPMTRTARVRFLFGNPNVVLKPGMYVSVSLAVPLGRRLVMPASGVLRSGTRQIAFLDRGNGYLEPREVEVGEKVGDDVVILKGLGEGERIVSSANFLVDAESQLQAAIGAFGASAADAGGSEGKPGDQTSVDFSTDPSPPRKGSNTLRVRVTSGDGKPCTGAEVSVTFFMAAMPAMGMAAIRDAADLSEKTGGVYEGPLVLQSGGTWQVTVVVKRGGQVVASKQFSAAATGGM